MEDRILYSQQIDPFRLHLKEKDLRPATIEKYMRGVRELVAFIGDRSLTKELALDWKNTLLEKKTLAPSTVNGRLAAANSFFGFLKMDYLHLNSVRQQRKVFRNDEKDLSMADYKKLVEAARQKNDERLALVLETICATGIRVSELHYITVEAAEAGCAQVYLKGKMRMILMIPQLCEMLLKYAAASGISSGEIFRGRKGKPLSRKQIWADMKAVCRPAKVNPRKVYPHNLRHLFARAFYESTQDVVKLADVLGHSNITTTRIYLISTGREHIRDIENLGLVF